MVAEQCAQKKNQRSCRQPDKLEDEKKCELRSWSKKERWKERRCVKGIERERERNNRQRVEKGPISEA